MKGLFLMGIVLCLLPLRGFAQEQTAGEADGRYRAVGIHTNVLYWGAMTPNIGMEIPLARQWSIDVTALYAPWTFKHNKKYRMWGIQPELRWWCCQTMTRHYVGVHTQYARYNIGAEKYRRDGHLFGGGISYGYIWVVNPRWNIDFSVGLGYARLEYDKYCQDCNILMAKRERNYWGPTKLGVTFVYKIPY